MPQDPIAHTPAAPTQDAPTARPRVFVRRFFARVRSDPTTWRSLVFNLMPFFGVLVLGWSAQVVVVAFWLEAVLAVLAMTLVMTVQSTREEVNGGWIARLAVGVLVFALMAVLLNSVNIAAGAFLLPWVWTPDAPRMLLAPEVLLGFAAMAAFSAWDAIGWLSRGDERKVRDELREGFYLSLFRIGHFALLGAHLGWFFAILGWWGGALLTAAIGLWMGVCEVMRPEILIRLGIDRSFHEHCERQD